MNVSLNRDEINRKREQFVVPGVKQLYADPPLFVRGSGAFLYDEKGREYLDMFAGICTVSVGHCHPKVTAATVEQVQTLQHTSTAFMTEPMVTLAERLSKITPGNLTKSLITNSGTEANEFAIRLARLSSEKFQVIALQHSYHGESHLAATLTANHNWRAENVPAAGIVYASNAYCYRCPFNKTPDSCGLECAKDVERVIQTQTNGKPAVMIAEPIQGVGGIITPPDDYFPEVKRILDNHGALFISDEVQTGVGRTGKHWFGISNWNVIPDLITMAKGLANGIPIGAVITTPKIAEAGQKQHINTFGGNPISSRTALAVLDVIEEEELMQNALSVGNYLMAGLKDMQKSQPAMGDVRGKGLMIGVEIVGENKTPLAKETARIVEKLKDEGVICGKGGLYANVIRIQPPLNITKENANTLLKALKKSIDSVVGTPVH
jgi:4-aminobutyrate aminotransferase-like enzyme